MNVFLGRTRLNCASPHDLPGWKLTLWIASTCDKSAGLHSIGSIGSSDGLSYIFWGWVKTQVRCPGTIAGLLVNANGCSSQEIDPGKSAHLHLPVQDSSPDMESKHLKINRLSLQDRKINSWLPPAIRCHSFLPIYSFSVASTRCSWSFSHLRIAGSGGWCWGGLRGMFGHGRLRQQLLRSNLVPDPAPNRFWGPKNSEQVGRK